MQGPHQPGERAPVRVLRLAAHDPCRSVENHSAR